MAQLSPSLLRFNLVWSIKVFLILIEAKVVFVVIVVVVVNVIVVIFIVVVVNVVVVPLLVLPDHNIAKLSSSWQVQCQSS